MVLKSSKSLLGEDWFRSFCSFRINPKLFLDKKKLTRDGFCLDVLKDLYLEHVEIQYKIHLLLLLQENSCLLITDYNLLEQVVGSLVNLCNILGTKSDKRLLKNQTLVTIVTILLSQNLDTSKLVAEVKVLLLKVIYNNLEDSTTLSTACKCLEELEEFFPGAVFPKIMLKFHLKDDSEISPFASHLLEFLPFMTHISAHRILRDLIYIVKYTPELSPTKTFKLYLQNLMLSSDTALIHLAFDLLDAFHSDLFSVQDEKFLLNN
ncbi:AP-5 complex subunit beta-1 [Caerostris extrusa]|uniref:AP-5 complex subunit beta-1 n=1 Tax=Caerostris extrusa TaxID=172846 RepID=A0AAV4VGS5_CAEEX|nr:AP-5 complex subunit beta-1 [Caerostris extrusa]